MPEGKPPRVTVELLERYDRPGPRYTSYPTAVEFHEGFDAAAYEALLAEADSLPGEPLSLYVHLPFCHERCSFCGCNVVATKKEGVADRYLDYLKREIAMVGERLPHRRRVNQLHWGGGTPTYHSPDEMRELWRAISAVFELLPEAEVAIEVDPRVTTREQVFSLRELGFNRLSMGVQDFTPEVQRAITRNQGLEETSRLFQTSREAGFDSVNVDLIYGLPLQTPETFRRSLEQVIALGPDRVAVYSFAYIPWLRGHQRSLDEATLPPATVKYELFLAALEAFTAAGYRQIGMDHFALPGDELALALDEGRLYRNFMGYTVLEAADQLGLGITSIGDLRGAFAQNVKKLAGYYRAIEAGRLPVERGYRLSADDGLRRHVIMSLMCNFCLDTAEVESRFGIDFAATFATELEELEEPAAHGFVELGDGHIRVTSLGRLFVRNVCMVFDRYLRRRQAGQRPVFSRTL